MPACSIRVTSNSDGFTASRDCLYKKNRVAFAGHPEITIWVNARIGRQPIAESTKGYSQTKRSHEEVLIRCERNVRP